MRHILDLDRYPLDQPGTPAWEALVAKCRADLAKAGMYNLPGFVRAAALREWRAPVLAATTKPFPNATRAPQDPGRCAPTGGRVAPRGAGPARSGRGADRAAARPHARRGRAGGQCAGSPGAGCLGAKGE